MAKHTTGDPSQQRSGSDSWADPQMLNQRVQSAVPSPTEVQARPYGYLFQAVAGLFLGLLLAVVLVGFLIGPVTWWNTPGAAAPDLGLILVVAVGGAVCGWLLCCAAPGVFAQGAFGVILFVRSLDPQNNTKRLSYATSSSPARALYLPMWHTRRSQFWGSLDDLAWTPPLLGLLGVWLFGASLVTRTLWAPASVPAGWPLTVYIAVHALVTAAAVALWVVGARSRLAVRRKERKALTRYRAKQVRDTRKRLDQDRTATPQASTSDPA